VRRLASSYLAYSYGAMARATVASPREKVLGQLRPVCREGAVDQLPASVIETIVTRRSVSSRAVVTRVRSATSASARAKVGVCQGESGNPIALRSEIGPSKPPLHRATEDRCNTR